MITVTPISDGTCIQVTTEDEENFIRVHMHGPIDGYGNVIEGMVIKSAKLGTLYAFGHLECE